MDLTTLLTEVELMVERMKKMVKVRMMSGVRDFEWIRP